MTIIENKWEGERKRKRWLTFIFKKIEWKNKKDEIGWYLLKTNNWKKKGKERKISGRKERKREIDLYYYKNYRRIIGLDNNEKKWENEG